MVVGTCRNYLLTLAHMKTNKQSHLLVHPAKFPSSFPWYQEVPRIVKEKKNWQTTFESRPGRPVFRAYCGSVWSHLIQIVSIYLNTAWILHHLWVTYFKRFCSIVRLFRRGFSEGGHREIDPELWNWPGSMAIENHVHMDTNRPFSKAVLYFQISYRNT